MASPQAFDKLACRNKIESFPIDQDLTTAAVPTALAAWFDMRDYEGFFVIACGVNLSGAGVDTLSIMADAESDGSDGNIEIVAHAMTSAPTAEGDYVILEASARQIQQEGEDNSKDLRYANVKLGLDNALDEAVVTIVRFGAKHPQDALSADSIT